MMWRMMWTQLCVLNIDGRHASVGLRMIVDPAQGLNKTADVCGCASYIAASLNSTAPHCSPNLQSRSMSHAFTH